MSLWSAIGLADRKNVDKLLLEIQCLKNENQILMEENRNLLIEKIRKECGDLFQAEVKGADEIKSLVLGASHDLWKKVENISGRREKQISVEGESVRKAIIVAEEQMNGRLSEIKSDVETTIRSLDDGRKESELGKAAVTAEIGKAKEYLGDALSHMKSEYSDAIHDVQKQQEVEIHRMEAVENACRDSALQVEKTYLSALEEIKTTSKKYQDMEAEERENLDEIKELSSQMEELGTRQRVVMEHLSQLCQDSDQFMEIQKSINDMWEIMKAVWVDSLLNEYEKEIETKEKIRNDLC